MWVVKLGGSLNNDPRTAASGWSCWCSWAAAASPLVCGGGSFADEVRRIAGALALRRSAGTQHGRAGDGADDLPGAGLEPQAAPDHSKDGIRKVLHGGHTALWLPLELMREQPTRTRTGTLSSDSIALDLARKLNAERLVVVKSCAIDPMASLADLVQAGVLDSRFASLGSGAAFPIDIVHRDELARMRSLLLADGRPTGD